MIFVQKYFPNTYRDSVALMQISDELSKIEDIVQASLIMATPANIELLLDSGLLETPVDARNNDLLLAIKSSSKLAADTAMETAEAKLIDKLNYDQEVSEGISEPIHSIADAIDLAPTSNLVLISCPGEYATAEAIKALNLGLNVMIFSDNVPLKDEVLLKNLATEKNLLLMGADCGTAIINGTPLGFANRVRRGNIGIISASGTGLQQVACLIDRLGGGISQAIGTGGRDLDQNVGGATMLSALEALGKDQETDLIILISKPPFPEVASKIIEAASRIGKPIVFVFIGSQLKIKTNNNVHETKDLETAARLATELSGIEVGRQMRHLLNPEEIYKLIENMPKQRKYLRALYTGGTFNYEALTLFESAMGTIYSNSSFDKGNILKDPWSSCCHTVLDLGDDNFTRGRPHPMIDHRLRNHRIIQEAADPETAVILLDIVLGFGAHENPSQEIGETVLKARQQNNGTGPLFVGFVCGTSADLQNLDYQEKILGEAGILLMESNAQAVRLSSDIISCLRTRKGTIT